LTLPNTSRELKPSDLALQLVDAKFQDLNIRLRGEEFLGQAIDLIDGVLSLARSARVVFGHDVPWLGLLSVMRMCVILQCFVSY
jgi:hypothetical protein